MGMETPMPIPTRMAMGKKAAHVAFEQHRALISTLSLPPSSHSSQSLGGSGDKVQNGHGCGRRYMTPVLSERVAKGIFGVESPLALGPP
jgi:hypothetical protein